MSLDDMRVPLVSSLPTLRIILIGPPAGGKGTIATWLQRDFGPLSIFSSGGLLQAIARQQDDHGERMRRFLASGDLMSDEQICNIFFGTLSNHVATSAAASASWILDGFPRTLQQAKLLSQYLTTHDQPLSMAIFMDIPKEAIRQRILDRWVHPASGRVYHGSFAPPKLPGFDDVTCEPLERRLDDRAELFDKRYANYEQHYPSIAEYYQKEGTALHVSGDDSLAIYAQIKVHLSTARFSTPPPLIPTRAISSPLTEPSLLD